VAVTDEELQLAGQLVDAATGPIRWSDYRDGTAKRLASLIEAKLQGRALAPSAPKETVALPLLDALRQSLAAARQSRPSPMATACRAKSQARRKSR
jgi:non-homologous end joining protein Ku